MTTLRSGISGQVYSAKASTKYGSPAKSLVVTPGPGTAYLFVQFGLPADLHKGATVSSATLRLYSTAAWSGTTTLTAQRAAAKWPVAALTYNNRPGVTGVARTVAATGAVANQAWEFDVTADVQAWVDGSANYGWRVSTTSTALRYLFGFKASSYKPQLDVVYTYAPPKPTQMKPNTGAVSISKPVVQYDSSDATTKQRVQVDPAANSAAPNFDTGWLDTTVEQLDLAATAYTGLNLNATTYWRVQVQNAAGTQSAWSDWTPFTRTAKATLTLPQPTATVYEPTPPFDADLTGIKRMQVIVRKAGVQVYDSKEFATTDGTFTPAVDVYTELGAVYSTEVRAWDGVVREDTVGDPSYVRLTLNVTRSSDNSIAAVTGLVATQAKPAPWVDVTWARVAAPDGWQINRNGKKVFATSDYTDLATGGSAYAWRDYTAPPNRLNAYRVFPVVNNKVGGNSATVNVTPVGAGVWLVDPDTGTDVVLWGDDEGDFAYGEETVTYLPLGGDAPVQVTSSLRGLEGSWEGTALEALSTPTYTVDVVEARLFGFKANPAHLLRLVAGDVNIPVYLFGLNLAPDPLSKAGDRYITVSFSFSQAGELPFTAVL